MLDRIMESKEFNKCIDCGHISRIYGEIDIDDQDESEVVCPKCESIDYYIMGGIVI